MKAADGSDLAELTQAVAALSARLDALTGMVHQTQMLAGRAYERTFDYPGTLARARASDAYAAAYGPDPLVSVVLPTFNRAALLCERGLASVLAQTHERLEVIVVGNACTDDTVERVRAIGDPRVTVVNLAYQEPEPEDETQRWLNSGTAPINHGLELASGSWVALQHDDDAWDADYLARLLDAGRRSRAEVVYARARMVDGADGTPLGREIGAFPPVRGQFGTQFAIFNAALRFFRYDRNCRFAGEPNDWNMARRMWEAGVTFELVPEPLATYFFTPRTPDAREAIEQLRTQR